MGAIGFGFGLLYLWCCISLIRYSTVRRCYLFSYFDRNNVVIKSHDRTDSDVKFLKYTVVRNTGSRTSEVALYGMCDKRKITCRLTVSNLTFYLMDFFIISGIVEARKILGGSCRLTDSFFSPSLQCK